MAGLTIELPLLLWLLISSAFAQAPQDPLKDFCRRYGHQTAVIDRKLYVDGGWVYANPILQNPIPTINQGLLYSDLNQVNEGMPAQYANLSKNSTVPDVAGGILWPDEVNKVFWLYGGEFSVAPSTFQLWGYDVLLNQWNLSSAATKSISSVKRVSYGAGTAIGGKGYYYGGYLNNLTNPLWGGPPIATSNLIIFDIDADTLSNNTGPDSTGRSEGAMVSIPASAAGMLIYFGGVAFPYGNSTEVPMSMTEILLYDVGDSKWYTQTATGHIPPNRRKFCAGATWAKDQSSYNIYIYGGFGFGENITGFDDVWILTLPTFEWIKWYPDAPGASAPHGLLTCNVVDNAQMIVMGGNFTNSTACDVPTVGAQHNLNLGQLNPTNAKWYQYLPNLTSYSVPPAIVSITGGSSSGGASNLSPVNGWSDSALSVYFGEKAQFAMRTPTRYIPTPTATITPTSTPTLTPTPKRDIGAIVGGVLGGVAGLIIIVVAIFFCLRWRKSSTSDRRASHPPPAGTVNEPRAESYRDDKTAVVINSLDSPPNPYSHPSSPYSTPPPIQTAHFAPYQHPAHSSQQYYPIHMQQPGYGFQQYHPMSGSSPEGMYTQQPCFPPPEIMRSSPPVPHEMPTAMTPGIHHVDHQPTSKRVSVLDSVSDQEKSRLESHSPTNRS